jgi:DNA polymerase
LSADEKDSIRAALTADPLSRLVGSPQAARSAPADAERGRTKPQPAPAKPKPAPALRLFSHMEALPRIEKAESLEEIASLIAGCQMCGLSERRTNTVPGEGDPQADLMFIGEAPGYNEDVQGRPFVGRAGKLLDDMIRAMGFDRGQVFIGNIIKCRPPNNRDPHPDEMKTCEPFLHRQLELIRPRVICALGRIAIQTLLRSTQPISKIRGKWHAYKGIPLMPTYHPAYLLRNPNGKRPAWEDLQAIMAKLEELKGA